MRYPAWKYLLILVVLTISTLCALPSLYPDEPAVQISGAKAGTQIDQSIVQKAEQILKSESISSHDNSFSNNAALLRLDSSEAQLKAMKRYVVALVMTMLSRWTWRQPRQSGYKKLVQNQWSSVWTYVVVFTSY